MNKVVGQHSFTFNQNNNSGEEVSLDTTMYDNGDGVIYYNQEISLQSYCNSASINLVGTQITPNMLRQLANELEKVHNKAELEIQQNKNY